MTAGRVEGTVDPGTLMAGVQDALSSRCNGSIDANAVQANMVSMRVIGGHEQDLLGTLKRVAQRGRILIRALTHPHPAFGKVPRLADVAHADADPLRRNTLEKVLNSGAVQRARSPSDNDHDESSFTCHTRRTQYARN
jgi:hypothetical protein